MKNVRFNPLNIQNKITQVEVAEALGDSSWTDKPGRMSLRNGVFTMRKGYYYRHGANAESVFKSNLEKLNAAFDVTDVDYGDHYASFKSGEGILKNSYWWMSFKLKRKDPGIVSGDLPDNVKKALEETFKDYGVVVDTTMV